MCHWPLAPRPAAVTTGRDLATRTPTSEVPMTDSAHSMNLRGARLAVKLCPNLIAVRALALVATFPAVASTAALATGSPDAVLLRLGEHLDRVIADYHAQQLEDRAEREPFEAKVER